MQVGGGGLNGTAGQMAPLRDTPEPHVLTPAREQPVGLVGRELDPRDGVPRG